LNNNIETKLDALRIALSHKKRFSVDDACKTLGLKRSSTLWILSNLSRVGRIARVARGIYTFDQKSRSLRTPSLSDELAREIDGLRKGGISFVLTGLDILLPFVQHQPTRILHMIYTGTGAGSWAESVLKRSSLTPVLDPTRQEIEKVLEIIPERSELVVLREKASRLGVSDSLASIERAFVDLYVEATRELIPFSVQEVAHIYLNMRSSLSLNTSQMLRYAHDRSIRQEMKQIIEFPGGAKSGVSSKSARKFLKILEAIER
jgi:hypothetical protein